MRARHRRHDFIDAGLGAQLRRTGTRPHVPTQHGIIGHDIIGAATVDPGGIHRQIVARQCGQPQRQIGRRQKRVTAIFWVAPGMRGAAVDAGGKIARSGACSGQRAIGQRWLVGQAEVAALGGFSQQRRGAERGDFLIAVQHHFPADAFRKWAGLQNRQRCLDDGDAALHVGHAGAVQRVGVQPAAGLKAMIGRKHRIHMASQQHTHRRVRTLHDMKIVAVQKHPLAAAGVDLAGWRRRHARRRAAQRRKGRLQHVDHLRQPGQIAAAGVDRRPRLDLGQHHRSQPVDTGQRVGFSGRQAGHPTTIICDLCNRQPFL